MEIGICKSRETQEVRSKLFNQFWYHKITKFNKMEVKRIDLPVFRRFLTVYGRL